MKKTRPLFYRDRLHSMLPTVLFVFTILCAIAPSAIFAQYRLTGKVTTANRQQPEFVTITLKQNTLLTSVTDTTGKFFFSNLPAGKYEFTASHIAFAKQTMDLLITGDTAVSILLVPHKKSENEVIVLGNKNTLERKADRFVFTIGNPESVKGANVIEALKQAPFVLADEHTGISLINKPRAEIYINNRRSGLSAEAVMNLLKNTPADNIVRIEIITTPSSNFQVKGNSGIINIIFKRPKTEGTRGFIRSSSKQAFYNSQTVSSGVNVKTGNAAITANGWLSNIKQMNLYDVSFLLKESNLVNEIRNYNQDPKTVSGGTVALDLYLPRRQFLSFKCDASFVRQSDRKEVSFNSFRKLNATEADSTFETINKGKQNSNEISLNGNYRAELDSAGSYFSFDIDYLNYSNTQSLQSAIFRVNDAGQKTSVLEHFLQQVPQRISNISGKAEYQHVLTQKSTLIVGLEGYSTNTSSDTYFGNYVTGNLVKDNSRSFLYEYDELIYAGHATFNTRLSKKVNMVAGMRAERTENEGNVSDHSVRFSNEYWSYLPYLSFSFSPKQKYQFGYTFSRRIERPAFWELNPFRYVYTQNLYVENNPFLQPRQLTMHEASFVYNNMLTFLLNFTQTNNEYDQFYVRDAGSQMIRLQRLNYGKSRDYTFTSSLSRNWLKNRVQSNISLGLGYSEYKGRAANIIVDRNTLFGRANATNTITLSTVKKWAAFVNGSYMTKRNIANGEILPIYGFELGIRKRYNKWSWSVWAIDILKGNRIRYVYTYDFTIATGDTYYDTRNLLLTVTYNFGNQKVAGGRNRNNTNSDIKNRTKR